MDKAEMAKLVGEGLIQSGYLNSKQIPELYGVKDVQVEFQHPPYISIEGVTSAGLNLLVRHGLMQKEEALRVSEMQKLADPETLETSVLYCHVEGTDEIGIAEFRLGRIAPM